MTKTILFFWFLSFSGSCFTQQNSFKCACSRIGLDSLWADSNKVSCYLIPVPKQTANPSKGKLYIAAVVTPSLTKSNEPPLLYLHGGPGIATVGNVPRYLRSKTWKLLREKRPIIFFDYRGTGFSEPNLCPGMKDSLSKFSRSNSGEEARKAYKISLYKKCHDQSLSEGIDISSFNSAQLADDAAELCRALKISNWSVYGVSYGTTVGLNLLRNHGKHITSIILDSPFPPNAPWLDFIRPFDTCFNVLESNISKDPEAFARFPSIRADFVKAVSRLNKTPVKIKGNGDAEGYDYYGDDFAWSIWSAMLSPKSIPFVPLAIHEVGNGNDSILSKWVEAFNDPNSFGRFSEPQSKAVSCYEARPRTVEETKVSLLSNYPEFSSFFVDFEGELCDAWQPRSAGSEVFQPVVSDVPALVLSGEYDPVCPPLFGEITAKGLSKSTLLIVPSASHAVIHADDCLRKIAEEFLSNPGLKPGTECVSRRSGIKFVYENLEKTLSNFN
ncbi:MAG: alpha/beta fold hydrolase [Chitinophagaceae bacterium]|nr:alpha/beta fold hydrolase [Chitinophagaceae bacterium]